MRISRFTILVVLLAGVIAAWLIALGVVRLYGPEEDYTQIEDGLYMGGFVEEPPPGTRAVLNLNVWPDSYRCEIQRHEPIRDAAAAPSLDWLREMVDFVRMQQADRRQTYVHCFQGVSRSGLVVTAYLMEKNDWTRDEALQYIRSKRPNVKPNEAFMQLLAEWEQELAVMSVAEWRRTGEEDLTPEQEKAVALARRHMADEIRGLKVAFDADASADFSHVEYTVEPHADGHKITGRYIAFYHSRGKRSGFPEGYFTLLVQPDGTVTNLQDGRE